MKFVPTTLRVNPGPPTAADTGLMLESVGTGLITAFVVNVSALEVPPPGAGVFTVTLAVPALATSEARMEAVNCVGLTKFVVRTAPFQRTLEPLTKFEPLTVSVKAASPAVFEVGLSEIKAGEGLTTVRERLFCPPRL